MKEKSILMFAPIACCQGLCLYLVLCLLATLTGLGLFRLFRLAAGAGEDAVEISLSPVLALAFWTLGLGLASSFRCPIRVATPWLWGLSGLLALYGLRRPWPSWRGLGLPFLACLVGPVLVLAPRFAMGITEYTGIMGVDGWGYTCGGAYFWEFSRGEEGCLPPLYHFGASLKNLRNNSYCMLGFLSPFVHVGDVRAVISLYQAWTLFSAASAVWFFANVVRFPFWVRLALTLLATVNGWMANLAWSNNLDNFQAVVYMPALAGVAMHGEARQWGKWLVLGGLVGGVLYAYAEGAPLAIAGAGLIALPALWRDRRHWRAWLLGGAVAAGLAALVWWPYPVSLLQYGSNQYSCSFQAAPGSRPGDPWFAGLLDRKLEPSAYWGLGGESYAKPYHRGMNYLGMLLCVLLLAGLARLVRQGLAGLAAATVALMLLSFYFLLHYRYEYACYKVIVLYWWCLAAGVVSGAAWLLGLCPWQRWAGAGLLVGALLVGVRCCPVSQPLLRSTYDGLPASAFEAVRDVGAIAGPNALMVAVHDRLSNLLAVYHLRDVNFHLGPLREFLHQPFMREARSVPMKDIQYVLTDDHLDVMGNLVDCGELVWAGGPYRLWKPVAGASGTALVYIDANGCPMLPDKHGEFGFWVAEEEVALYIFARSAGKVEMSGQFRYGPEGAAGLRTLTVTTDGSYRQPVQVSGPRGLIAVPVHAGMNRIALVVEEARTASSGSGGRELPRLGIWGMKTRLTSSALGPELFSE